MRILSRTLFLGCLSSASAFAQIAIKVPSFSSANDNGVKKIDYICNNEKNPDARWFIAMHYEGNSEGGRLHADVYDEGNKKCYDLFCENTPYYGNYLCHNSPTSAYYEGYVIFDRYAPYYPSLSISYSDSSKSTTTTHYYKCNVEK